MPFSGDSLTAISVMVAIMKRQMQMPHPVSPGPGRGFGLTWEDECSMEAHCQCWRYMTKSEPWPGMFQPDPPSVNRPPPGWTPPPYPPGPPMMPVPGSAP